MSHDDEPMGKCQGCGKQVQPGEARYTASEPERYWHYDCWERDRGPVATKKMFDDFDLAHKRALGALDALKGRLR